MAITVPAAYYAIPRELLAAGLWVSSHAAQPLTGMLANTNFLYANHSPPVVSFTPRRNTGMTQTFLSPVVPSADGLDYTVEVCTYKATAGDVTLDIGTDPNSSWPLAFDSVLSTTHAHAGLDWDWWTATITLAADVRFLEIALSSAANDHDLGHVALYPATMAAITSGAKASGFIAYDAAHLAGAGAAVHREYFDRVKQNVAAVLNDRRQAVFSYIEQSDSSRFPRAPAGGRVESSIGAGAIHIPGQAAPRITVRCRAANADSSGIVTVAEEGGDAVQFPCDDDDHSATLQLRHGSPIIRATCTPAAAPNQVQVFYCTADWAPGD